MSVAVKKRVDKKKQRQQYFKDGISMLCELHEGFQTYSERIKRINDKMNKTQSINRVFTSQKSAKSLGTTRAGNITPKSSHKSLMVFKDMI